MSQIEDAVLDRACRLVASAVVDPRFRPAVASFFDQATSSVSHVLHDPATGQAVIVDPVLDYDAASGRTSRRSADRLLGHVTAERLEVVLVLETHVHADHLSSAAYLRERLGVPIGVSRHVREVRDRFGHIFGAPGGAARPESFDRLFADGDVFRLGGIECIALHVPGHTPADMAFVVGDVVLTGDTLFMPDFGTARTDFPGGDARRLFRSVRRLLALPAETRLLHCHDYPPPARGVPAWSSTVGEQRARNLHVQDGVEEDAFVTMRTARDATLSMPSLMMASVQVNLHGGELPEADADGRRYLRFPLDAL